MLKNYIKITVRGLLKLRTYLLVNILGLSVGMACAILAVVFVVDEYGYDAFHSQKDSIWRIVRSSQGDNGVADLRPDVSGLMAPTAVTDIPEVLDATRVLPWFNQDVLSYEQTNLKLNDLVFADENFFKFFDFKLLQGNPETVLKDPGSIVLTATVAEGLFKDSNPIGKSITGISGSTFTVTGIVEDAPRNSHLQYTALMSWKSTVPGVGQLSFSFINNWLAQTVYTYVMVSAGADNAAIADKLHGLIEEHLPQRADDYGYDLQALNDIYLGSDGMNGNRRVRLGSNQFLNILAAIAIFVLVIACLNYVNITTSKATKRSHEIGVRKVLGAQRQNLVLQFLGDTFILCLISAMLAILMVDLFIPYFNDLTARQVDTSVLLKSEVLFSIVGMVLAVTIASGIYPAVLMASLRPSQAVKKSGHQMAGSGLRQGMIVFQFLLSALMIIGSVVIYQQHQFLLSKELGFDKENVITSSLGGNLPANYQALQTELEKHPDIVNTAVCQAAMISGNFGSTVIPQGTLEEFNTQIFRVDFDYIDVWGLEVVEGRKFDANRPRSEGGIIVNEAFLNQLGWDTGTDKTVKFSPESQQVRIIGVVKDFYFQSLTSYAISPALMYIDNRKSNLTVKTTGNNTASVLAHMEQVWEQFEQRIPFGYTFVDDFLENQYATQSKFFSLIGIFSLISVIIACLGLYGLTAFMIEQRTKEIGIRKVLGATIADILYLINKRFVVLVTLAFVLATPVGYYFSNQWLEGFPYRIPLGIAAFLVAGISVFLVAVLTTSWQALRASKMDPVNSLRYE